MAWNRPSKNGEAVSRPLQKRKGFRFPVRGAIAGAIVVFGAGVAAWWLWPTGEMRQDAASTKQGLIKEVTPAAAPTNREVVAESAPPKKTRPTMIGETVGNFVMLKDGRIYERRNVITNSVASRPKRWHQIFEHKCNNEIALMLTLEPGESLVGERHYNGTFKRSFLKSLATPIIVTGEDTPEQAQLKRDVIAARLELKDAMDRGEDIEQIMIDSRSELQRLNSVKREINKMYIKEKKNCKSPEDVKDLFDACNKMLEEKGISPLANNPITKGNFVRSLEEGGNDE